MIELLLFLSIVFNLLFVLSFICILEPREKRNWLNNKKITGKEIMETMIREIKDQRLTEIDDYSGYFNEGLNLAIDIAERYEEDFK